MLNIGSAIILVKGVRRTYTANGRETVSRHSVIATPINIEIIDFIIGTRRITWIKNTVTITNNIVGTPYGKGSLLR